MLNQTLADIEVIAVNDGSDDSTLKVLKGINDDRLKIISHLNYGQGYARNNGMSVANGKYIAFVDADDTIEEFMLEKMYEKAETENADMVQCNLYDIYPDRTRKIQLKPLDKTVIVEDKGEYADKYFSTCYHSYEICNKLIRRSFLEENNLKFCDTKKYFSEDLMFNLKMLSCLKKVCFISEPYYNYYQYETSHFHNVSNGERRLAAICDLFIDYMAEAEPEMKKAVSFTASMIVTYNIGRCAKLSYESAYRVMTSHVYRKYLKSALTRKCSIKHKAFFLALLIFPLRWRMKVASLYAWRWEV